ncbi:MAG: hypothetical protein QOH12_321 [Solirubrobacteraceae bacterium]|jgi:hypothetical protein|nr:hypothetical protein [Solirubrobacteraceae bacterium]
MSGDTAGWRFEAPTGDVISAVTLDRDLYLALAPGWVTEIIDSSGAPLASELCAYSPASSGCELQGSATHLDLNISSLAIQILCEPALAAQAACSGGASIHRVRAELNSATVTVTDNQPPAITAMAGSLLTSSGYQRGVLTGTVSGADNSGVSSVRVYVDGNPIVQSAFNCDYTYAQPCPATGTSSTLSLDTTRLGDGTHRVQAAVIDAAGNETRGPVQQLLVSNHPPAAPTGPAITNAPTGWTNHSATVTWKNPAAGSGLPVAGVAWITCRGVDSTIPPTGCGAAHSQKAPLTSLDEDIRTEPAFAGRLPDRYTVFVWLVDSSGAIDPAAAAHVGFGFDDTAPGPPSALKATASSTGRSFVVRATPPAHLAPIVSISWTACTAGVKCSSARVAPGQTFDFAPATDPTFMASPRGRYLVRAWLRDAAGNANPGSTTSVTLTYAATGTPKPRLHKPSPRLRVASAVVHGRDLRITGSTTRALKGRIRVVVHAKVGSVDHILRRSALAAAGHFVTAFVEPHGARLGRITVTFDGDRTLRSETVTRTFAHL